MDKVQKRKILSR